MNRARTLMLKHDVRAVKSLGQNFLVDVNIAQKIVDSVCENTDDVIFEIGPGTGSLTELFAKRSSKVIGVELDKKLIPLLNELFEGHNNVKIVNEDAIKFDFKKEISDVKESGYRGKFKLAGNLPYYITTPLLMKILEDKVGVDSITIMIQKEVADRIVASPGGKEYGALSVAVRYYGTPKKIIDVSPHCFTPQPNVTSSVLNIKIQDTNAQKVHDDKLFFMLIKAAFGQRRKNLVNAIFNSGVCSLQKDELKEIINRIGFSDNIRGECLDILHYVKLTNLISERIS